MEIIDFVISKGNAFTVIKDRSDSDFGTKTVYSPLQLILTDEYKEGQQTLLLKCQDGLIVEVNYSGICPPFGGESERSPQMTEERWRISFSGICF